MRVNLSHWPVGRWVAAAALVAALALASLFSYLIGEVRNQSSRNQALARRTLVTEMKNREALVILCEQTNIMVGIARDTAGAIRIIPTPARLAFADRVDVAAATLQSEPSCGIVGIP